MNVTKTHAVSMLCLLAVLAATPVIAAPVALATLGGGPMAVDWKPVASDAALSLTISGPGGFYLQKALGAGEGASFGLYDAAGQPRPDGVYVWELRAGLQLDDATRAALEPIRDTPGFESALASKSGPVRGIQTGSFSIVDGALVLPGSREDGSGGGNRLTTKATVLTGSDGVIRNSLCVGFDCPSSPSFGDTTILMMENNARIKFDDTSVAPFPLNDWEIEANSASSGGQSYLGFNDCGSSSGGGCATDLVFAVESGARQSALYVESDGDVGLGTSNPALDLHIVTGNTPAMRLEQDASSGFGAQSWDVAGNETSFFIRDVTGGSALPFRIRPGSSSSTLVIDSGGEVGVGILSPDSNLNVLQTNATSGVHLQRAGNPVTMLFSDTAAGKNWEFKVNAAGDFAINDPAAAGGEATLTSTGNLTIKGTLVTGGPSCGGGCDLVFSPGYEVPSIEEHAAEMWSRSHLPAVGPTPEGAARFDVTEKTGGILNELEKAHIYIEQLNDAIKARDSRIEELAQRLARLEDSIEP